MVPLHFYNNLQRLPDLALNALPFYNQGINYLNGKAIRFLHVCEHQLQNTARTAYPILRHPRRSTISGILFATKYIANITRMEYIYQKAWFIFSKRASRAADIEYKICLKLKELSSYCKELNVNCIPWQKFPDAQALDNLKAQLRHLAQVPGLDIDKITKSIDCCDEIGGALLLFHSIKVSELSPEEIRALQEDENINAMFSAIEENAGEALGGYAPQILGPTLYQLLNAIPDSFNPLLSVSNSVINKIKKISTIIISSSLLSITSTSYFVSSNAARTLLQLSTISGVSTASLYFQDHPIMQQAEESAKNLLQISLELTCSYAGMLSFGTNESFTGYLQKIIPAIWASKAVERMDFSESYAITSFALPFLASSIVYNQEDIRAFIQEKYTLLKRVSTDVLNGEAKKQLLRPIAAEITEYITKTTSNILSHTALQSVTRMSPSSIRSPLEATMQTSAVLQIIHAILKKSPHPEVAAPVYCFLETNSSLRQAFSPLILSAIKKSLIEEQSLNLLSDSLISSLNQYLTILQQDDMQQLLLKIQHKLNLLDPEVEDLIHQFYQKVFFKMTGKDLPLDLSLLNKLNKNYEIHTSLFTSFNHAPTAIRIIWNSYSYEKKVNQVLTLELLLQGFIISGLSNLNNIIKNTPPQLSPLSYAQIAGLGINLIL